VFDSVWLKHGTKRRRGTRVERDLKIPRAGFCDDVILRGGQ
jgi:hypothetical protein